MAQITGQGRYLNPVQNVLSEARTLDIAKDSKMNDILPLLHENEIPVSIGDRGIFKFASVDQRDHASFLSEFKEGSLRDLTVVAIDKNKIKWS
jgi:hypothetical protein